MVLSLVDDLAGSDIPSAWISWRRVGRLMNGRMRAEETAAPVARPCASGTRCCGRLETGSSQLGKQTAPCSGGDAKPLRDHIAG
jgi:hypothetical protein